MRNFTFSALTFLILSLPTAGRCQLTLNWARSLAISGASNAHIATDRSGNIYVAGNSSVPAYNLIKISSAGALQWSTTGASGTSNAGSGLIGVGTDNAGNIYLVSNCATGIYVGAFNTSGGQLWSTTLNYSSRSGSAHAMKVDAAGNVYIGGQIHVSTTSSLWEYMTIRVSGGVQKYLSVFEGSGNQFSYVTAITSDASGNAYVTGTSIGAHTYLTRIGRGGEVLIRRDTTFDMTTIKYDSLGNAAWTNTYNAGINTGDFGFSVAVDNSSGNVYALGQSSLSTGLVGDLVAYTSAGAQLWVNQNTAAPNNNAIAVDPSGNILTGGVFNFNVSKFNSVGTQAWTYSNSSFNLQGNQFGGNLTMALDGGGNCYITSPLTGNTNYFTAQITTSGTLGWSTTYGSGGQGGSGGIAIYTPVSRIGMITYPLINVTGTTAANTAFTTLQYTYKPVLSTAKTVAVTATDNAGTTTPDHALTNFPNPFRGNTTISYTLANDSHVTLQVFDLAGKPITLLFDGLQNAGPHTQPFNADRLAAGVYFYRIIATSPKGNSNETRTMAILP